MQSGFGLIELLVAMALSLLLVLAASAVFIACRTMYLTQDDSVRLQDTGRFAIESIGRAVAQAGFVDAAVAHADDAVSIAPIAGLDNRTLKSTSPAIQSPVAAAVNGSDVLALHFAGAGDGAEGDSAITNCAGFSVARTGEGEARADRGWSIFYVAKDHTGEPELYCKYRGKNAWATAAIARGVESFQVLYGIGDSSDSLPTRFLNASQIDGLDRALSLSGTTNEARSQDANRQTHWKKISQIKVALVVRGTLPIRADVPSRVWNLFGERYANATDTQEDPGVRFDERDVAPVTRNRLRKLFQADFRLRNVTPELPQ